MLVQAVHYSFKDDKDARYVTVHVMSYYLAKKKHSAERNPIGLVHSSSRFLIKKAY